MEIYGKNKIGIGYINKQGRGNKRRFNQHTVELGRSQGCSHHDKPFIPSISI